MTYMSVQEIQRHENLFLVLVYLAISFAVIYFLYRVATKRRKKHKPMKEGPFWLEKVFGNTLKKYATRSFLFVVFLFILDYSLSRGRYSLASLGLTSTASFSGLLLSRWLYHNLNDDVLPYINELLQKYARKKEFKAISNGFLIFVEATGRSVLYQGVCCTVTLILFIIFYKTFSYELFPSFWSRLLCFIITAGIVGPLSTTISGFIIYCEHKFSDLEGYDFMLLDNNKMVKKLGGLALHSSFISALSAGIAIPAFLMAEQPGLASSFTFFLTICVSLFFFVPVYYIYTTTGKHKTEMLSNVDTIYEKKLKEVYKSVKTKSTMDEGSIDSFLALKEIRSNISEIVEWPLTPVTSTKVILNVTIPAAIDLCVKILLQI